MTTKKFTAVLNKKVEPGKIMNALAHMTVGLVRSYPDHDMGVINYEDKDGGAHRASKFPFIILRADNSNKIRALRNTCIEKGISFASFKIHDLLRIYNKNKNFIPYQSILILILSLAITSSVLYLLM